MPITPLHLLAGVGLKAAAPSRISYGAFAAVNILVDVDSAIGLMGFYDSPFVSDGQSPHIHGAPHSFLLVTILALVVYAFMRKHHGAFLGAFIGGWSHIALDMFYHSDLSPFIPFTLANPFYGLVPPMALDWLCVALGVLLPAYFWRSYKSLAEVKAAWNGKITARA
ncbi:MAG: hypothetical protein EG825_08385 [Rhodocyclaceae bacterium]|nr:hypothetical protein [Rhodocyclaceae bacterium]